MGTESVSSDALLLLLETVNKQASQIKRLEAVVSGSDTYSSDISTHRHGERSSKQLQQVQTSLQALEQQHVASSSSTRSILDQMHKMEQRMQQLEQQNHALQQQAQQLQQQLGSPAPKAAMYGQRRLSCGPSINTMAGGAAAADDQVAAHGAQLVGMPGGRSMAARLSKLEHQVEALISTAASTEEKLQSTASAVQTLEDEVSTQLHNIRSDVKQAITVASKSVRADLEATASNRRQEETAQLKEQLKSLSSELDGLVAKSQRTLIVNLTAEIERRTAVVQDAADGRITALRVQLDRLEEEKADIALVTQYTGQVADVFEQLAATVADSTQASIAQLMTQQQELRNMVTSLSASKADGSNLLQHQQHCQQQLLELQRGLAGAQAAASEAAIAAAVAKTALEPVDALRLQLAETQGMVAALQATAAGLEAATNSSNSEQQQQAQSLQQLASTQHMLQQQLMALTNHVDPAAAAQLAAAAAGDESALTFQPLGPLASGAGSILSNPMFESLNGGQGSVWEEAWATSSYLQCSQARGQSVAGNQTAAGSTSQLVSSAPGAAAASVYMSAAGGAQNATEEVCPGASEAAMQSGAGGAQVPSSSNGGSTPGSRAAAAGRGFVDRMSAVLRHLPVAVRLLRLETAVRDLHNAMAQKAPNGELQGLQQQLDSFSERLVEGLTQLEGVSSSSMQHLQEQSATLADAVAALGDGLDERPTHAEVAAKHDALQQQLGDLTAELEAVKVRLRGAGQDVQHLKDWQVQASQQVDALQQVRQQVSADLSRQQQEVQQMLAQHSAEVARDTMKQLRADQEGAQGTVEAAARVVSLESKLKVVVAEVDRIQEQATLTARLQDKHTDMVAALEAALSAQSSKYAAVSQQLRLELKETLAKATQANSSKVAALETSLKEQSDALADLAVVVAELPNKGGLLEAALKSVKSTVEGMLAKHRKQEEGRWEVWLAEFARAIEQRPTAAQLQKQLQAAQQATESCAQEAASQRIHCVTAAMEASLRQQLRVVQQQLEQLCDRTQTLEQGTGIGEGYEDTFDAVAAGPDSPSRTQLLSGRPKQAAGLGAKPAAAGGKSACDASHKVTADSRTVASTAAAAGATAQQEAAQMRADAEAKVNVAAIVAAFEGSPVPATLRAAGDAKAAEHTAANPVGVQSLCFAAADSPALRQWRELPIASPVLAEATGAAAAAAAAGSPGADSSVAARNEGDSSSDPTVEGSSVYSSCEGDSNMHAAARLLLPQAADTAAAAPAPAAAVQPAFSVESSASAMPVVAGDATAEARALLQELQRAACTDATAQESVIEGATDVASPSVRSVSPEVLQGLTPISKPRRPAAAAAAEQSGMLQGYSSPAVAAPNSTSTPTRPAPGQLSMQQASPMQQGALVAEASDCTSELQQLLDLQQQVQQCLLDSGCVAVGRRAKPPKDRQHKKVHRRSRLNNKEGSAEGTDAGAAAGAAPAVAAAAAGGQGGAGMTVDAAIAAAAAAMADRQRAQAGTNHSNSHQQQPQQQHAPVMAQEVAAQAPVPAAAPPASSRPNRSDEIRSLLSLQQQLAQCLKDHGCFLEQQRQQQQAAAPAEPFMSTQGGSSIAGLQQQQQQQGQAHLQGQRYSVQERELEQLLMLQAQMQQAVRHQGQ